MKRKIIEAIGWYGVAAILAAYAAVAFGLLGPDSLVYQVSNLTGALSIIIVAYSKKDTQPVILNMAWAAVALAAIIRQVIS